MDLLLRKLSERLSGAAPVKPTLRIVGGPCLPPVSVDDAVTRDCRLKRIRWLSKAYRLQWLVDQHCFRLGGPAELNGEALAALHKDMERARACAAEGIPFEDAGLIRSNYQEAV